LTQQVHWLDFNKGILLLEMHGTNIKKNCVSYSTYLFKTTLSEVTLTPATAVLVV
jgi:hypothetical protein